MSLVSGQRRPFRLSPPPVPENPGALSRLAVESALSRGFAAAGVAVGASSTTWGRFRSWLDEGRHGAMAWLDRDAEARKSFDSVLPFARSALVTALEVGGPPGNVARYARGEDYHAVVRRELKGVAGDLRAAAPPGTHFRACVDTAPLLERELAVRAGLGFIGKNTLLIVPRSGSHVVLGVLLTDVEMAPTGEEETAVAERPDPCGRCTACLEACPTGAFPSPRFLDATRCIAYLTIEKRGPFVRWEAAALGGRLFGCDTCQDVCPWNARPAARQGATAVAGTLDPEEIARLSVTEFEERFGATALRRATHAGLVRNARALLAARKTQ